MKYKTYWEFDNDHTWHEIQGNRPSKVSIDDKEVEWSGLLNADGDRLYKVKNPIGFKCRK